MPRDEHLPSIARVDRHATEGQLSRQPQADDDGLIVVSKDAGFRHSHTVAGTPAKLMLGATGNIRNDDLVALWEDRIGESVNRVQRRRLVELHRNVLIVHCS